MEALPPPPPRKGLPIWAWVLIIVGIVGFVGVVLIAIVAAIAIPGLVGAQRASNERNAMGTIRSIMTAQADFRANDRDENQIDDYWTGDVFGLYALSSSGRPVHLIESNVAMADASPRTDPSYAASPPPRPMPKAGYLYSVVPLRADGKPFGDRSTSSFAVCAFPADYPRSGRLTLLITEDGQVWRKDTSGARVQRTPESPAADGWSRLD